MPENRGLYQNFEAISDDEFYAAYDALTEGERRRFSRNFFVLFAKLIDGQAKMAEEILARSKTDDAAAPHIIGYGVQIAKVIESIRPEMQENIDLWRLADGRKSKS